MRNKKKPRFYIWPVIFNSSHSCWSISQERLQILLIASSHFTAQILSSLVPVVVVHGKVWVWLVWEASASTASPILLFLSLSYVRKEKSEKMSRREKQIPKGDVILSSGKNTWFECCLFFRGCASPVDCLSWSWVALNPSVFLTDDDKYLFPVYLIVSFLVIK